ncbi:protease [Camelimonas fluminis]|uniref:Signal peptide peptidase SppA n=1 Tax=Camelimonas fluminis TaxID=1576911 RepID=A0ABV7UJ60_9HYPH|nr:signal peptide peptidase SppA [Camelimonas fluminis]GHE59871.1 protease [Camelimonas fluminis]
MLSNAELLTDRRALRRRLTGWRALAILAAIVAVVAVGLSAARDRLPGGRHVARVSLSGMITGARATLDLLKQVGESSNVQAVVISIDSPGGTVAGSEDVYNAIRALAAKKPTVAVINTLGASGAYIAAMGADRIVARQTSLVGSIGVIMQFPNFAGLLDRVGVKVDEIKSSPLKAAPNPFEPASPAAKEAMAAVVGDSYAWFRGLVQARRRLEGPALGEVADGRIFTGRQALQLRLIDQTGDEKDAVTWLEANRGLAKDLPVREWRRRQDRGFSLIGVSAGVARAVGFGSLATTLERSGQLDGAQMEGLLAVWTGSAGH